MYKSLTILSLLIVVITACHRVKDKTNEALNKAGETAGQAVSEFANGVGKGIDETADDSFAFAEDLKAAGIQKGKAIIKDSAGHSNVLSVYLIFNKDFSKQITVKVLDKNDLEYGRITQLVTGKKGDASFVNFYFANSPNLESKSKFIFE